MRILVGTCKYTTCKWKIIYSANHVEEIREFQKHERHLRHNRVENRDAFACKKLARHLPPCLPAFLPNLSRSFDFYDLRLSSSNSLPLSLSLPAQIKKENQRISLSDKLGLRPNMTDVMIMIMSTYQHSYSCFYWQNIIMKQ